MAHQRNEMKIGNYSFDAQKDLIVEGKRGPILRCKDNSGQVYCLKVIRKLGDNYRNEIEAYKRLKQEKEKHFNTLRVYELQEDNDNFYIFTELCEATFDQYLSQRWKNMMLNFDEIQDFLGQIVKGYQYLRKLKINVRDLTPKTILVQKLINDRMILKVNFHLIQISDYCIYDNGRIDPQARTPIFQSPELFNFNSMKIKLSDLCDIYALGVILYMMCFKGDNITNVEDFSNLEKFHEDLKAKNAFQCPKNAYCQKELLSLISQMIVYNPEDRIKWEILEQRYPPHFFILSDLYFVNIKQVLGSGAQGSTYIAQDLRTNEQLVCKIIPNGKEGTLREKQIVDQIKKVKANENVIKIAYTQTRHQDTCIIMEKCDESLQNYLKGKSDSQRQLENKEIIEILYQIVQGYCFLKQIGVIHRDLKPDNILIKKIQGRNVIKIIDFGVGKIIGKEVTFTEAGTPLFAAPEVLKQGKAYDYQCDIFSLGVILHYLAFLRMFKDINNRRELLEFHNSLETRPFYCEQHQLQNPLITELINKMIVYDPKKRITWEQLQVHSIFDELRNIPPIVRFTETYKYIFALYNLASRVLGQLEENEKDNIMLQDSNYPA
ncbi:unnamed protein product (macronuclear) [Paramecium tetraurelia]|uniref:Protein kinase domain-containing protein n=1 Tax=Paramecium tetraurelia TaxID=5888 RepID=A0BVP1_PARTE|nr:uncharacterized protein GSPATT00032460001 [Paramecium tetraurelia]CAK62608.1 unnamed protein product [Paramecium tetraurelia]|eukprot:XP_001430006.1 hypothetical protein (macronuclear) [Paramecium tetraurelia strain d4-2]